MLLRNMNVKELILQEAFYQNFPLEVDKFIDYCKKRGLNNVDRKYLEHLEQEERLKPIMRVVGSVVSNTTDLNKLYENNHVIDPSQNEFVPWKTFHETRPEYPREVIRTYYHPYQIYSLNSVLEAIEARIRALIRFNNTLQNDASVINLRKPGKNMGNRPEIMRKESKKDEKFVELLLFIQNKYLPIVKQPGYINITGDSPNNLERWYDLKRKIIPKEIVSALGLKAEEIKEYRGRIGGYGLSIDPLENWYDLVKYIKYAKRQKLKGKALLAQDFYIISNMLALLLEDLTGEKQLETGSISDTMQGRGNVQVYGKELNYVDRDILIQILREYGINPRPQLILIVEGYTEEIVFPIIANAMGIPLERYDIQIINIQGVDKDPRPLIIDYATPDVYPFDNKYYIHLERTKVFFIFDNEGNKGSWSKNPDKNIEKTMKDVLRNIKNKGVDISANIEKMINEHTVEYHIWNKSFEYDNITDDKELSRELNKYGEKHGYKFNITSDEIKECRANNRNLGKFVEEKKGTDLGKREFGEQIGNFIAKEIKERTNHFENQRPIEEVLNKIIRFTVENI